MGSVWEKMDFLHVLRGYLHQRKLIAPFLERAVVSFNAATKAITRDKFSTEEVTDAVKLYGGFWELVKPNCRRGPCHTDAVSAPAGTKSLMPNQSLPVISENIS